MYICYEDILRRIKDPPKWWLAGVPRYEEFSPDDVGTHAMRVALVYTRCGCGRDYLQGVDLSREEDLARLAEGTAGLGDPPNAWGILGDGSCTDAATSCCEVRVLQCWERISSDEKRRTGQGWRRQSQYEVELYDWMVE